jgi:hypothetical protein
MDAGLTMGMNVGAGLDDGVVRSLTSPEPRIRG